MDLPSNMFFFLFLLLEKLYRCLCFGIRTLIFLSQNIIYYDVTLNMTVTGFCVICVLGHHTDADSYSFLQLCRALFTSLCVILVKQNGDGPRKFMYLFTCVFILTEAASPSFFFSSSRPFFCRLSSPVILLPSLLFFHKPRSQQA